jgi:hypothetical protein
MDADSFTHLALRVLAREATADEQRALDAELSSNPEYRDEFEQMRITHDALRTIAPMTEAARATAPELPSYRLNELRTAVRQHFGPTGNREKKPALWGSLALLPRWFVAAGAMPAVIAVVWMAFADHSVEVGLYRTDLVRGADTALSPEAVPSAHIVTFYQDASFDQWQKRLAWYQHAKIWIDDEHNLLHVVRRGAQAEPVDQTEPLAQTNREQREQIRQAVESVKQ